MTKKKISYSIEDSTIAEILGIQSFSNPEAAVLELVKNAYDAGSTTLHIQIGDDVLIITDSGQGMNAEDIESYWMHVGKSNKGYSITDMRGNKRVLSGSKGVGRFALARLGSRVELRSWKRGSRAVVWQTDWNNSTLDECTMDSFGTTIRIRGLRDTWSARLIMSLRLYLSRMYIDDSMKIVIQHGNEQAEVGYFLDDPVLGINCTEVIRLGFDSISNELNVRIDSDEFKEDAQKLLDGVSIHQHIESLAMVDELYTTYKSDMSKEDFAAMLSSVGSFTAELQFRLVNATNHDVDEFLYRYLRLPESCPSGIALYRNAFSIASFDGTKDWIGLGRRARRSPASPSHPTGNWRVRENQLAGKVLIDKARNPMIRDMANRQGIEENEQYHLLVLIVNSGLKVFERYRQGIIRAICASRKQEDSDEKRHTIDLVASGDITYETLGEEGFSTLRQELTNQIAEERNRKRERAEAKQHQRYDARVLNVLATSGLKAASIAHQLKNEENNIRTNSDRIMKALIRYGLWDQVSTEERTAVAYRNIPGLLREGARLNTKMAALIGFMLGDLEKERFDSSCCELESVLEECFNRWRMDFSQVDFELNSYESDALDIPADVVQVMFDNLILNSIQQNPNLAHIRIKIIAETYTDNSFVKITYSDNGIGLDKKYRANPMRILEVHETTRSDGHGLGMWILNNSLVGYGGKVLEIGDGNGFMISFVVRRKKEEV